MLRYEAKLSAVQAKSEELGVLGRHLTEARDNDRPVRMIVRSLASQTSRVKRVGYHVRPDLLGKVIAFDGDHFIVDFTRPESESREAPPSRRK